LNPKDLAGLLKPFAIHSHNYRDRPDKVIKGYHRKDFQKAWTQYLPPRSAVAAQPSSAVAADAQNPSTGISGQQPEASNQQLIGSDVAAVAV
jgi:hypothetical protein